jgi:hypothetical protein
MKAEMIPLLRKGVEWAEAEAQKPWIERRWWQNAYFTSAKSLATSLLLRTNLKPTQQKQEQIAAHCGSCYCMAGWLGQELDPRYVENEFVDGVHVAEFVMKEMGFTRHEASELFSGTNSIQTVRYLAEQIAGEPL